MRYVKFTPSGISFESRETPSELLSVLGHLALAYAELQERVEGTIHALRHEADPGRRPQNRRLPFDKELDDLGDLIAAEERRVRFNSGHLDASELRLELIELLRRTSKLFRQTMNPRLLGVHLRREAGPALTAHIMDVSDYVTYADCSLDEFFLDEQRLM